MCVVALLQAKNYYVFAKSGLNLRAAANTGATVLTTIAYGEVVNVEQYYVDGVKIEGVDCYWVKVKYKNYTGFLVDMYLIPNKPPIANTASIDEYFSQVSTLAFKTDKVDNGNPVDSDNHNSIQKNIYKNNMEVHNMYGYEYSRITYFFPYWSKEQVFNLLKSIGEFKILNEFGLGSPGLSKVYKKGESVLDVQVSPESIKLYNVDGAEYDLEILDQGNQIVLIVSSSI